MAELNKPLLTSLNSPRSLVAFHDLRDGIMYSREVSGHSLYVEWSSENQTSALISKHALSSVNHSRLDFTHPSGVVAGKSLMCGDCDRERLKASITADQSD